jgi:hypothetical protein
MIIVSRCLNCIQPDSRWHTMSARWRGRPLIACMLLRAVDGPGSFAAATDRLVRACWARTRVCPGGPVDRNALAQPVHGPVPTTGVCSILPA